MGGILWGIILLLVVVWLLVKIVFGIAGALFHLLLVAAVVLALYHLIKAGAQRRV